MRVYIFGTLKKRITLWFLTSDTIRMHQSCISEKANSKRRRRLWNEWSYGVLQGFKCKIYHIYGCLERELGESSECRFAIFHQGPGEHDPARHLIWSLDYALHRVASATVNWVIVIQTTYWNFFFVCFKFFAFFFF